MKTRKAGDILAKQASKYSHTPLIDNCQENFPKNAQIKSERSKVKIRYYQHAKKNRRKQLQNETRKVSVLPMLIRKTLDYCSNGSNCLSREKMRRKSGRRHFGFSLLLVLNVALKFADWRAVSHKKHDFRSLLNVVSVVFLVGKPREMVRRPAAPNCSGIRVKLLRTDYF